ncbi:hypothetical protein [Streptomyces sp. NPDC004788]
MSGFLALCQMHLSREESEILCGWTVLVALLALPLAEKLAAAIDLPGETPATCDNLDLSTWFRRRAKDLATTCTGPWTKDLDTAFYVALFLRAAQHSIRRGCPIVCT